MSETETAVAPVSTDAPFTSQTPLEIWRTFSLNGRRSQLDQQGLDIAERQEKSSASRKQLTVSTRSFKASMSDQGAISKKDVGHLLKGYQSEVDALTNRAKAAESSFLSLYKALYEVPDPVEELSRAMATERLNSDLRDELRLLKEERGRWAERTAAAHETQKKVEALEAQLADANERIAEEAREALEEKQSQWMTAQQKAIEAYEMREQELLHQLRLSNENARRLQTIHDDQQHQLNEVTSQLKAVKTSRANVNEMTVEDLERTRAEAKSLKRRCLELESRLHGSTGEDGSVSLTGMSEVTRSGFFTELAARDVEVSQLKDQVAALEEVLGGKDQEKRNDFAQMSSSIADKDKELKKLRIMLDKLPTLEDYEVMSRQFEALKSYQLLEDEHEASVSNAKDESAHGETNARGGESLEKRLLAKVKSMEGRVTRLRVEVREKDDRISEFKRTVQSFEEQISDQKSLISNLEDGINAITGENANVHTLKRRAAAASRGELNSIIEGGEQGDSDEAQSESTWDWGERHQAEGLQNIIREEPSMLDIVAGQRDRFRGRSMELEGDNRKLMEQIEKLTSDLDSLKSDNVRLYEKIRFVQSYKQSGGNPDGASLGSVGTGLTPGIGEDEESAGFLGKYRSLYEDMMNPYTIFSRRARHRRMSEMSAPERLTFRASQRALSTKTSRLVVFIYIISLHVLVALVLGFSASTSCAHVPTTQAHP